MFIVTMRGCGSELPEGMGNESMKRFANAFGRTEDTIQVRDELNLDKINRVQIGARRKKRLMNNEH